jgi:hypothetical protein
MQKGLITSTHEWFTHATYSDGDVVEWAAGLVAVLLVAFLWSTVVSSIE